MDTETYTIGDLARMSGLSVLRIRAWENRHGEPGSLRLPSGHRRYTRQHLTRLLLLSQAVEMGKRISDLKGLTEEQISSTLTNGNRTLPNAATPSNNLWSWRLAVRDFQSKRLEQLIKDAWICHPNMDFLNIFMAPFVQELGMWWANGEITVAQEHFASAIVEESLSGIRHRLNPDEGTPIVLCTLPAESHTLGLQMAAVAAAIAGVPTLYLGRRIPLQEIPALMRTTKSRAICLSFSISLDRQYATQEVRKLRHKLPADTQIVLGGAGAPSDIPGTTTVPSLDHFFQWCQAQQGPSA